MESPRQAEIGPGSPTASNTPRSHSQSKIFTLNSTQPQLQTQYQMSTSSNSPTKVARNSQILTGNGGSPNFEKRRSVSSGNGAQEIFLQSPATTHVWNRQEDTLEKEHDQGIEEDGFFKKQDGGSQIVDKDMFQKRRNSGVKISKTSSGTNLMNNVNHQRRPSLIGRSSSSNSITKLNHASPKTPKFGFNNSRFQEVSSKNSLSGNLNQNSGMSKDRNRLVEQFYNNSMNKNPIFDLANGSGYYDDTSNPGTPNNEKWNDDKEDADNVMGYPNKSTSQSPNNERNNQYDERYFENMVTKGGFNYDYMDKHIKNDVELTDYLLNIDVIIEQKQHQHPQQHSREEQELGPLVDILDKVVQDMNDQLNGQLYQSREPPLQIRDLNLLKEYLNKMKAGINELFEYLQANKEAIKQKYQASIKENVHKLDELTASLESLENRLNKAKDSINFNKSTISNELLEKFNILEYINDRFDEHAKLTRNRRFKQLNISLAIMVLLIGVYIGIFR
ncbi:hypothetical protein HYPBUDRAFT_171659 [Hyphopichia burtonii NRRL Y-1933]|uniref:Uncharacterized protein n=1 Tax=Hyphopichia burtonii NRRL Y-1933 TaxID=984485 RepID=A0A1E4RQN3_9ASCO|nr:hypothetical protein HYPBUDRAFT_171659 [Hyphopichia burtonii NRRL Y-1933]ODV69536.1 hypothetical protein HYPBUDRAFT_171659 [Hyphopichia burtonii NRRL Y-1933]